MASISPALHAEPAQAARAAAEPAAGGGRSEFAPPKKVFVAGATGNTGRRIVRALQLRGISVLAGVRSLDRGREVFPDAAANQIEFVQVDVTQGADALARAMGADVDAVICATGFTPGWDPTTAWRVDRQGTVNLVDASRAVGAGRFVLISSILTNGAAWGQIFNPAYLVLNLFGLVLLAKLAAERYIERSGIYYTIVRPGGLRNEPPSGNLVMSAQDTLASGSISRDTVAEVAVEALLHPEASFKTVEIISTPDAAKKPYDELFAAVV